MTSWAALEDDPGLAGAFPHVVALDPPAHAHRRALSNICRERAGPTWPGAPLS